MRQYLKYILRGFRLNISRFIAVIAIVALGVGMLVGLLSSPSDLHQSLDKYYDDYNMMDIHIKSTIGFDKDTIEALKKVGNIVEGIYQDENKTKIKNKSVNARRIRYAFNSSQMNSLELIEGRIPKKQGECVALFDNSTYEKVKISEIFSYDNQEYEVVGIAKSPMFFGKENEYNLTGTTKVDFIFYADSYYEDIEQYTDIFLRYETLKKKNCFEDSYFEEVKNLIFEIQSYEQIELDRQKNSIKNKIYDEVFTESKKQLQNQYPEEMVNFIIEGEAFKENINTLVLEKLDEIIEKNGYEWYVLNRKSNLSFVTFIQNVDKINKIAVVFPVFFYFIAALVALTTITRLVEEERTSIGLLKSIGYSKTRICVKYAIYGLVCSILGAICGALLGIFILPYVIHIAFNTLYDMPKCLFSFNIIANFTSVFAMIITIVGVAVYVALKTLKERPCQLLLSKAPKPGNKILIEQIPFLWKKIKFKYKNMLRNIFRYKRNMFMMIIGVGGCVSLLLCAFGIKNAIESVGPAQYNEIFLYDIKVKIEPNSSLNMEELSGIEKYEYAKISDIHLKDDMDYDITMISSSKDISSFIELKNSKKKKILFEKNSVIITKQLSDKFHLKEGSKFLIENDEREYIVTAICTNYIGNYIYIFEDIEEKNVCFINISDSQNKARIIEKLSSNDIVRSIEDKEQIAASYNSMADSLTLIVLVIILCSGALASIVIYNLTNININERFKEIATLKVLGYQKKEVCGFIYREVFALSLIGILAGFILGPALFVFIVYNLQGPGLRFDSNLQPIFFLYAFLITCAFVGIVDVLFISKIQKIKMVESLKCVD